MGRLSATARAGTYLQTGGTNRASFLRIAFNSASSGTLSGGWLNTSYGETIGYGLTGTFTQSGGTNTVPSLYVGINQMWQSFNGTYNLVSPGGLLMTNSGTECVGSGGSGTFNQSAGTNNAGTLQLGIQLDGYSGSSGPRITSTAVCSPAHLLAAPRPALLCGPEHVLLQRRRAGGQRLQQQQLHERLHRGLCPGWRGDHQHQRAERHDHPAAVGWRRGRRSASARRRHTAVERQ